MSSEATRDHQTISPPSLRPGSGIVRSGRAFLLYAGLRQYSTACGPEANRAPTHRAPPRRDPRHIAPPRSYAPSGPGTIVGVPLGTAKAARPTPRTDGMVQPTPTVLPSW